MEMLHDARVASLGIFKNNVCTTRINKEKKFKVRKRAKISQNVPSPFCQIVKRHLYVSSHQWLGSVDMHIYAQNVIKMYHVAQEVWGIFTNF